MSFVDRGPAPRGVPRPRRHVVVLRGLVRQARLGRPLGALGGDPRRVPRPRRRRRGVRAGARRRDRRELVPPLRRWPSSAPRPTASRCASGPNRFSDRGVVLDLPSLRGEVRFDDPARPVAGLAGARPASWGGTPGCRRWSASTASSRSATTSPARLTHDGDDRVLRRRSRLPARRTGAPRSRRLRVDADQPLHRARAPASRRRSRSSRGCARSSAATSSGSSTAASCTRSRRTPAR